jgi:hypothetical protein
MKKRFVMSAVLLLIVTAFAAADKYAPPSVKSLSDELQWLAMQTACIGQYSMARRFRGGVFLQPRRIFCGGSLYRYFCTIVLKV